METNTTEQIGIPQKYLDMVGTKKKLSGGLFSIKRSEPSKEYDILDIRWGDAQSFSWAEATEKNMDFDQVTHHPQFELRIKSNDMKRARWTRGFTIKEISIVNGKVVKS